MAAQHKQHEETLRRAVRDVIAIDPMISARALARAVSEKTNITVSYHYVQRLMTKATGQVMNEIQRAEALKQIAKMAERFRMLIDAMQKIVYAPKGEEQTVDRTRATLVIAKLEQIIMQELKWAGFVVRLTKRNEPMIEAEVELSDEMKMVLDNVKKWGFGRAPADGVKITAPVIMLDAAVMPNQNGEPTDTNAVPAAPKIFKSGAVDIEYEERMAEIAKRKAERDQ